MRIKKDFMLCSVAGENVVVPVGEASVRLKGVINLNESGSILWKTLSERADMEQLIAALTTNYGISSEEAEQDVNDFLTTLRKVGCIEE